MKPVLTDELVGAAAALLARHTGLVFPAARRRALEDALARLSRRIGGAEACVERLAAGDPGLFDQLIADITVGETYFFRHPGQLAAIRELVLPELASRVRGRPIRIWSAGCASGEEAYTLAILALEAGLADRVQITATDLSRLALARAVRGRFGRWSLRSTPDESRTRYFREAGTEFELLPEIRRLVTFAYHNLATDPYPALGNGLFGMDLVLCRNVMIYLDAEVVARVSRQLVATLAPGGWLIAGAADPSIADHAPCEVVIAGCGLLFRRNLGVLPGPAAAAMGPREPESWLLEPAAEPVALPPQPRREQASASGHAVAESDQRAVAAIEPCLDEWVRRVRAAANRGELELAERTCILALERFPHSPELLLLHGFLLGEAGRYQEAANSLRAVVYLDRQLAVAHLALGVVLARLGMPEAARRALRNADRILSAVAPDDPVPLSDGEPASRLKEMGRVRLSLLMAR